LFLSPLPAVRWLGASFGVLLVVNLAVQFRSGQFLLAGIQLLLGLVVARGVLLDLLLIGPDPPRSLAWIGDGLLALEFRSGRGRRVRPAAATMVWSRSLLLVLEGEGGPPVRLLLGPGNVSASQLAALRREWLRPRKGLSGPLA
jgi:hypothetical protein